MSATFAFKAIGTSWNINIGDEISEEHQENLRRGIMNRIEFFDKTYSRFRDDSIVSEMSRKAGEYILPTDAIEMFSMYKKLYDVTEGMVTPLMGKVLVDTGYDPLYSLRPKDNVLPAPLWADSFEYEHPNLKIKKPVSFDFGAIGKGYLVDIVADILKDGGINNFTVDAGGDIAYQNKNNTALKVGLENPDNLKQVIGVAEIINKSICGSAGNRRAWNKYTHIINPKTVESPKNILAVWVIADRTITADGLTTALFFTEPEVLKSHFDFEYAIIYSDHSVKYSPVFHGNFFSN